MKFEPEVWGPHYWFFLHTVARTYPDFPNEVTKRKYYDLIQNFPLFIPVIEIGNKFSVFLDKYPVSPYLKNRESFKRWVNFIHNKINTTISKTEMSYFNSNEQYERYYLPKYIRICEKLKIKKYHIFTFFIIFVISLIYFYYE